MYVNSASNEPIVPVKPNDTKEMGMWVLILDNETYPTIERKKERLQQWLGKMPEEKYSTKEKNQLLWAADYILKENKNVEIHITKGKGYFVVYF
jgi:hypothetical protein